ncbi:1-phosphofructokinase family hexose kinase [Belnapia sp. T18]|uniref:Phosphofructokinase n=1 Tax=Belnapia arida TaxID=2804533 RepID=A0ABS1U9S2_9PROT|nr:1-phosphofructokinase family hexose kinase [Belnapia arida]MBL6081437.1 1-phosphofructokinase family hexose kinase [Belnapia arida]
MAVPFVTLALNPAIDQTVELEALRPGAVNLARGATRHPAGKGVNVAACLADWGVPVTATGLLGEANDAPYRALFAERGIKDCCVRIPGETRTNVKLLDRATGATTDINLPGTEPEPAALEEALAALHVAVGKGTVAVLAGSLPPGLVPETYADLVGLLTEQGARVVVDASGPALAAALEAPVLPHAVKPNRQELEGWAGRRLADRAALLETGRELVARGVRLAVVSLGAEGALFVTANEALVVRAPALQVAASSVGAGDAMVAGIATGLADGLGLAALACRATGFAAAKLQMPGAQLPGRAAVEAITATLAAEPVA